MHRDYTRHIVSDTRCVTTMRRDPQLPSVTHASMMFLSYIHICNSMYICAYSISIFLFVFIERVCTWTWVNSIPGSVWCVRWLNKKTKKKKKNWTKRVYTEKNRRLALTSRGWRAEESRFFCCHLRLPWVMYYHNTYEPVMRISWDWHCKETKQKNLAIWLFRIRFLAILFCDW